MNKKKKFFKALIWIISILCAFFIVVVIVAYGYFKFFLMPRLTAGNENSPENDSISITEVATEISDKQILENIFNFDKQSAREMLIALNEIEAETKELQKANETKNDDEKQTDTKVPSDGKTAYQRIMNEASQDEIAQGMAIIAKVDISKVNQLRKEGKNNEIKAYVKSVLTSGEISAALKLYNKYKHLL